MIVRTRRSPSPRHRSTPLPSRRQSSSGSEGLRRPVYAFVVFDRQLRLLALPLLEVVGGADWGVGWVEVRHGGSCSRVSQSSSTDPPRKGCAGDTPTLTRSPTTLRSLRACTEGR